MDIEKKFEDLVIDYISQGEGIEREDDYYIRVRMKYSDDVINISKNTLRKFINIAVNNGSNSVTQLFNTIEDEVCTRSVLLEAEK